MLQNSEEMDVLQDTNKLCIYVEDIEYNGLKTSMEDIFKWQNMP